MATSVEQLVKYACDATERIAVLEHENNMLKTFTKHASYAKAPVVSESLLSETCNALVGIGAINEEQVPFTKQAFRSSPDTACRVILGLADAQMKKAASDETDININGGCLVDSQTSGNAAHESCIDRIQNILGMY